MPLDTQSVFTNNNTYKNCYNLAKNITISIPPNTTYIYKHGFYFHFNNKQKYYIQIDDLLSDKLILHSNNELNNLNDIDIKLFNNTSDLVIIPSYQPIINLSPNKFNIQINYITEPEVKPVEPEVKPVELEVKSVEPEVKPIELEVKSVEPEVKHVKPVKPEVKHVEPEVKPVEPEVKLEVKPVEPEVKPEVKLVTKPEKKKYIRKKKTVV